MRPTREKTNWIVVHRINVDNVVREGLVGAEAVRVFFEEDPEGVATVTHPARGRAEAISLWRRDGIPEYYKDRAYTPYHDLIDRDGIVTNTLAHHLVGAHAYGANGNGIGIGVIGDFRKEHPTDKQVLGLKFLLRDLLVKYPAAKVVTHDDIIALYQPERLAKRCPGKNLDVRTAAAWAKRAAGHVADGSVRR